MTVAGVERMRFHGPGWTAMIRGVRYQLWAPQDGTITDPFGFIEMRDPDSRRGQWAASWQSADGEEGDFVRVDDLESAVAIFPVAAVRDQFRAAVESGRDG